MRARLEEADDLRTSRDEYHPARVGAARQHVGDRRRGAGHALQTDKPVDPTHTSPHHASDDAEPGCYLQATVTAGNSLVRDTHDLGQRAQRGARRDGEGVDDTAIHGVEDGRFHADQPISVVIRRILRKGSG